MGFNCVLCTQLEKKEFILDDKKVECAFCLKEKYNKDGQLGFYSMSNVLKSSKSVKEIEENCDCWDDRLKPKHLKE